MKLISFSLWGNNPKYTVGAIRNAELAKSIYPGWRCRYYVANDVPLPIILTLQQYDNVDIVEMNESGNWKGMFWRFMPASESDVEIMISRDTDSRLNDREKAAVNEWINSDKGFHIMRDHPHHGYPVLGGMWGVKNGMFPNMKDLIDGFSQEDSYGTDYKFFDNLVFPKLDEENAMVHDEFFEGQPFPTEREGFNFVGQVFDENEQTVPEHVEALKRAL
jgi:protein O-GlcNAc transferase